VTPNTEQCRVGSTIALIAFGPGIESAQERALKQYHIMVVHWTVGIFIYRSDDITTPTIEDAEWLGEVLRIDNATWNISIRWTDGVDDRRPTTATPK